MYNGKAKNIRTRLKAHLNNSKIKTKILNGEVDKIPLTGCLSLESLNKREIENLLDQGKLQTKPNFDYLKHSKKLSVLNKRPIDDDAYLLNGINIFENKWNNNSFGLIIITTDSSLGASIIEESFRILNGIPPLCKL